MRDAIAEFMEFNRAFALRNPELLRLKVARMAASAFAFFRGTFHLFARDVLDKSWEWSPLMSGAGAEMDLVGDIHSENYGTYKAADSKVHYDINDFDETTRGRFDFDISRLATSWFLAAHERGDGWRAAALVLQAGLAVYAENLPKFLKKGGVFDVSELAPCGCPPVDELIRTEAMQKRSDFIGRMTQVLPDGKRRIHRSLNYFNLPEDQQAQAYRLLDDYVRRMPEPSAPDYYKPDDVCGRVAGIGSMGRFRYAILVNGKGKKEARNVMLEFKESRPSAFDLYRQREIDQAAPARRAEQVIAMQRASQSASSAHLGYAVDGAMSFQVREIGPHDARIDFKVQKTTARLEKVAELQAMILARTHARAAARTVGVANPLAELADTDAFCQHVLAFALAYADLARRDWTSFVAKRGDLETCEKWA